ncbi:DUF1617 family protein [Alkalibacterium thalassium]|uniref:Phage protein n=1 Tax=Alkalibacterium thalassium TaxID=426701 RepID=A0A1G8VR96_9LACT|nr:DUF1617 family protein [Alkalibacterium thalassium]SDJ67720.1 Protein of unknown function [Alkalibacterium thalassium]
MKTIKLRNKDVVPVYNALDKIVVEGHKPRRGKGRLQKALKEKDKEYVEDLNAIRDDYFQKTEDGNYKQDSQGKVVWIDKYKNDKAAQKKVNEQIQELLDEEIGIDLVEHESKIKSFYNAVINDEFKAGDDLKDEDFETLIDALEDAYDNENTDEEK